jgi:hypothetical protein
VSGVVRVVCTSAPLRAWYSRCGLVKDRHPPEFPGMEIKSGQFHLISPGSTLPIPTKYVGSRVTHQNHVESRKCCNTRIQDLLQARTVRTHVLRYQDTSAFFSSPCPLLGLVTTIRQTITRFDVMPAETR